MVSMSYFELALVSLAQAVLYLSLGVILARWWAKPSPETWDRSSRDYELDRYGSAMDGSLSRIRWLPVNHEGED
jgi:hypothetical protein